ncbi:MAG TPA: alpha/beta hydrolase [Oscillatoriales cyanobacterium M59_W2019_021]|nr:MAG: alpha/beta hydrolase [Cyanobacteria bacterium J055]HIK33154.1 alpha/beta hydrolase [Oscillatoriales cyanobacterium M4454_W2019_049]HIK50471.1 alpha/beta hydrolase [Oscillatoriales cyanobacterium M59_W2019_021]
MAEQFIKGGQECWFHDRGHWGGFFHTYDRFQVAGPEDTPRTVHLFLPRNYEVSRERYPVIYANDGHTVFFPGGAYGKTWNLPTLLSRLYLSNAIGRVIIVAIAPVDRDFEYTHAPVWGQNWGGLDAYARYLAHSVKGFIDDEYRTLPEAENTLILGSSHGGLAAFYTATQHPDKFRRVAALSPSFWVGLDSVTDMSLFQLFGPSLASLESSALVDLASKTLKDPARRPQIYLDWGLVRDGGFHNAFIEERSTVRGREMRDLLIRQFGYRENEDLFVVEDPIGQHTEESWSGRMEYVLRLFFGFDRS